MHDNDGASAQCAADLLIAYNQLNSTIPNFFPAPLLGNGQILNAGVYSISGAATLSLDLTLHAQGNSSAVFIFQIQGPFSTGANSKVKLINGALACNVFWKVEGAVNINSYSVFKGTIVCNNGAMGALATGVNLEGRALTTTGALSTSAVTMIAGQNIRFLDGTRVFPGGYLHGYITTTDSYCCAIGSGMVTKYADQTLVIPETAIGSFFSIYPNPTSDKFYLEVDPALKNTVTSVHVFGMVGDLIQRKVVTGNTRYEFSLGGNTTGIYYIRVMAGDRIESKKIIRN